MKKILFVVGLAFVLSGCSLYSINSEDATDQYYPPKSSTHEVTFVDEVNRPHEVIGYVTVNTERRQSSGEVVEKLKREAAILGGDAVTSIETNSTGFWKKLPAQKIIGNAYIRANFRAKVIIFK